MVLSPLNVFTWGGLTLIALVVMVACVIAFTPLREWIPGYQDSTTRTNALLANDKADSMNQQIDRNELYLQNLQLILEGKNPDSVMNVEPTDQPSQVNYDTIQSHVSKDDSALRKEMESALKYDIVFGAGNSSPSSIQRFAFFTPMC